MSVKPITPSEVASEKLTLMPDEVISAFNEMIASHYSGGSFYLQTKRCCKAHRVQRFEFKRYLR